MSRTIFLAALAVAAIVLELFPDYGATVKWGIIVLAVAYLAVRAFKTYPRLFGQRRLDAAQNLADEMQYREFEAELEALRTKFSVQALAAGAAPPADYEIALKALNEKHRDVLIRKFGAY